VIADQAAAIAAYYKQIKDDESVKKFIAVKLRAWRRIGEICAATDRSDCKTKPDYVDKIQQTFPDLSFSQISQALRLAEVPMEFFEQAVEQVRSIPDLLAAYTRSKWEESPEGLAQLEEVRKRERERKAKDADAKEAGLARECDTVIDEMLDSYNVAYKEVGYTLERRDRRTMKTVVLLLKESVHSVLRQAAFDHHLTMQEVVRRGLVSWLASHGYTVD
jgi:hypothetical protein